jgi:quercetin dioxygenase-like cupin family protein
MSLDRSFEQPVAPATGRGPAVAGIVIIGLAALLAGLGIYGASHESAVSHGAMQMSAASNTTGDSAAARPRAVQHPIACEKLPNVPGKSITTLLVEFPPNAFTPRHRHPGSVTAYVTKGILRSQLNDGPVGTFGVGGTWFEPPGTIHSMVENPSPTEPAEIMAIFVADSDCGALTIFDN